LAITLTLPSNGPAPRVASGTKTLASQVKRAVVPPGSPSELAVESAEQRFALQLTQRLVNNGHVGNVVLSPESIEATLAMLELGARGATQHEIAGLLGSVNVRPTEQAAGWNALTAQLASDARGTGGELTDENAVFVQRTLPVRPSYLNALKRNFGAGIEQVDFQAGGAKAAGAINSWVSRATGARIPQLFGTSSLPPITSLVLVDAMRFSGRWQWSFAKSQTALGRFDLSNGKSVNVPMMHLVAKLRYFSVHQLEGVVLPYAGGRFDAIAVEPRSGSLSSVVLGLTPASLTALATSTRLDPVAIAIPRFSVSSEASLDDSLRAMGLAGAFASGADFSGISASPLRLGTVAQRDVLSVDESGTDATGASGVGVVPLSLHGQMQTISFDHPFLFVIRDNATGAIITDALVADPSHS